jgi:hypothetical protein
MGNFRQGQITCEEFPNSVLGPPVVVVFINNIDEAVKCVETTKSFQMTRRWEKVEPGRS